MQVRTILERHLRTFRPTMVAEMPNPETWFEAEAERIEALIESQEQRLMAAETETPENDLDAMALMERARRTATEIVLQNEVWSLAPEPGAEDNELPADGEPYPQPRRAAAAAVAQAEAATAPGADATA
jgi:hypothetical protein